MNAIIYARVSTRDQSEFGHSLKAQEKECRAFAAGLGYSVLETFIEEGESAKTVSRTQLTLMMQFMKRKKSQIDALIVWDIDRLSRNPRDYYDLDAELKKYGITILTVKGTNDSSPIGKLVRSISVSLSEFENEQKKDRVIAGQKQAIEQGRWPFRAPVGYTRVHTERGTGDLIPDPETGPFIIEAFRMMESGNYSQRVIIDRLGEKGFRVSPQTLNKILHNPIYCGLLRSEFFPELKPGLHEPLVSKATFTKVLEIMEGSVATSPKRNNNPDFPLRRFLSCGTCGAPYTGGSSRGKGGVYPYYRCRISACAGNIPREYLENQFRLLLENTQPSAKVFDAFAEQVLTALSSEQSETLERMTTVSRRLQELREQKTAILQKLAAGVIGDSEYKEFVSGTQSELLQLQAEEELLSRNRKDRPWKKMLGDAKKLLRSLRKNWEASTPEQRIQLQNTVFPGGLVYKDGNILNPGNSLVLSKLEEIGRKFEKIQDGAKKRILNPVTSLHSNKIPAQSGRVSPIASPRGIEPLLPE